MSEYPDTQINAPPVATPDVVNDSDLHDTKTMQPGKWFGNMNERTKFIISGVALLVGIILSFVTLAVFEESGIGFAILFIIAFGLGAGQMLLYVDPQEHIKAIKESKMLLIVAGAFAAVTFINLIVGCASELTGLVVFFLLIQWALLLFYNFKMLPNGLDGVKAALL